MAKKHTRRKPWPPDLFANLERAYLKYHHEAALEDAVLLTADRPARDLPRWIGEALRDRARADILGTRKTKKRGRPRDFARDYLWFDAVQERRDEGMPLKAALYHALEELKRMGEDVKEHALRAAYKRHRKLVRPGTLVGVGRTWLPRAAVYVPRLSAGLPEVKN